MRADGATELKAVAWDIDGTLVDSEPLHHRALLAVCGELNTDVSDLHEDLFRGIHMGEVWTLLHSRLPPGTAEADWRAAIDDYYAAHRHTLVELPEATATIRALARLGVPQVCVSNSSRSVVDANLAALGIADALAFSLSLDDVARGKPDPEPYASACARLGFLPSAIAAVEDSGAGARSAQAAGLYVVAYRASGGGFDQANLDIVDLRQVLGLFPSFSARRSHAGAE